jgi:hypothetical protein
LVDKYRTVLSTMTNQISLPVTVHRLQKVIPRKPLGVLLGPQRRMRAASPPKIASGWNPSLC